MWSERARKRSAFFRLGHDQCRVAELVAGVPEGNFLAQRGAKMIDRLELGIGNAER